MDIFVGSSAYVAGIAVLSGALAFITAKLPDSFTRKEDDSNMRLRIAVEYESLYCAIRNAQSWQELITEMNERGYKLFPAVDDICGVNFRSRRVILLSDSGHYFSFIVEKLGLPPEKLIPEKYATKRAGRVVRDNSDPHPVRSASA